MLKEHPVLFSTEMVKAIIDGRKTMTRRVVSFKDCRPFNRSDCWPYVKKLDDGTWMWLDSPNFDYPQSYMKDGVKCPYGEVGDRLWVRETWTNPIDYKTKELVLDKTKVLYKADSDILAHGNKWHPSIFMPRKYSRIILEITNIMVEKLKGISPVDCKKEGSYWATDQDDEGGFINLWDSINAKRGYSWESNPGVWVIEFKKI